MSLSPIWLFVVGALLIAVTVVSSRFGWSYNDAERYLRDRPGVTRGIVLFIIAFVVIPIPLAIYMFAPRANAEQGEWFKELTFTAGVLSQGSTSPFCLSDEVDDKTTSFGQITASIYKRGPFNSQIILEHHNSCALNGDTNVIDMRGVQFSYTFDLHAILTGL